MNCGRFDEIQAAGDIGNLEHDERLDFERHLSDCASCTRKLRELVLTGEILKGLLSYEEGEALPPLPENLVQRILAARRAARVDGRRDRRAM